MKERLRVKDIHELINLQREIFSKAFLLVKSKGVILYATCSVLKEENEEQIEFFCQNYPVKKAGPPFQTIPTDQGPDGFFCQLLERE